MKLKMKYYNLIQNEIFQIQFNEIKILNDIQNKIFK